MKNTRICPLACILALLMAFSLLISPALAADETVDEAASEISTVDDDPAIDGGLTADPSASADGSVSFGFNPGTTGSNFSIKEIGSSQAIYSKDASYSSPIALEAGKTYEFWSCWEYDANATSDATGIGFTFQSAVLAESGSMSFFNAYVTDYDRTITVEDAEAIWYKPAEDLEIEILTDTIKVWSDGQLGEGVNPDPASYDKNNNYLWDVPVGYDALDGIFKPGQACYVGFQITTKAVDLPETPEANADESNPSNPTGAVETPTPEVTAEPEEIYDPTLPRVFKGEVDSSNRALFTEETRPDYAVFNSVTNNTKYGDETKFVRITDLSSGKEYLEGTIQLVHGRQYQVQVLYRNDSIREKGTYLTLSRDADAAQLLVTMPYELAAGTTGRLGATISAENTMPLAVSAGVDLRSDHGVSLQYVEGSAVWQKNGSDKITAIDYEKLFRDGVSLGDIGSGVYGTVTFTIQVVADDSVVANLPENEISVDSDNFFDGKAWNVYIPIVVASVLTTLLFITVLIALLDALAPLFHPTLRSFPIIRHCAPMPGYAKPQKPEDELTSARTDAEAVQTGDADENIPK